VREVPVPTEGPRRERIGAVLQGIAAAYEEAVAMAPDQWWTVFHRIWDDLPGDTAATARSKDGARMDEAGASGAAPRGSP